MQLAIAFSVYLLSALPVLSSSQTIPSMNISQAVIKAAVASLDNATNQYELHDRNNNILGKYNATDFHAAIAVPQAANGSVCSPLTYQGFLSLPGRDWFYLDMGYNGGYLATRDGAGFKNDAGDPIAFSCISPGPYQIRVSQPVCNNIDKESDGRLVGTDGQITLGYTSGYATTASMSTTETSSLSVGVTASVQFGVPEVASGSLSVTTTVEISNSVSRGFDVTASAESKDEITLNLPNGSVCHLKFTSSSCTAQGVAEIPVVVSGWVRIQRIGSGGGPGSSGPRGDLYMYNLAGIPTMSEYERSAVIKVQGGISSRSLDRYSAVCS
ncbi:hypothetical protein B0H16DRAFT_1887538 [Mycena metata]|uniref:Uncharacterized protein n=1 Tax=Mycena metata TaxID=1033252 RepID=A0AAD7IVS4_9AGAR|nr:hypothetical protein B0H16DRAFT_1887538 [Mycena metata]